MGGPLARHCATRSPRVRVPYYGRGFPTAGREIPTRTSWRTLSGYAKIVPSIPPGLRFVVGDRCFTEFVLGERNDWEPRPTPDRRYRTNTHRPPTVFEINSIVGHVQMEEQRGSLGTVTFVHLSLISDSFPSFPLFQETTSFCHGRKFSRIGYWVEYNWRRDRHCLRFPRFLSKSS